MRFLLLVVILLGPLLTAEAGQDDNQYSTADVRNLLRIPGGYSAAYSTGFSEKILNRLGDRISIALLKILDEKDLENPMEIRRILPLIHDAFAFPKIISIPEDRSPKVTLFFLKSLELRSIPDDLKDQISELTKFIKHQGAT